MATRRTLFKHANTQESIEKQFDAARNEYNRELAKLRKKYQKTLASIVLDYGSVAQIR